MIGIAATLGELIVVVHTIFWVSQTHRQVDGRFAERYDAHQNELNEQSANWASGIRLWTHETMSTNVSDAACIMEKELFKHGLSAGSVYDDVGKALC